MVHFVINKLNDAIGIRVTGWRFSDAELLNRKFSKMQVILFFCSHFYQHFTREFFVRKCLAKHFSSYVLALKFFGAKGMRKMLMKLTPVRISHGTM